MAGNYEHATEVDAIAPHTDLVKAPMDEQRAREILQQYIGLNDVYPAALCYVDQYGGGVRFVWMPGDEGFSPEGAEELTFTAEELEAIAWWMRNKGTK